MSSTDPSAHEGERWKRIDQVFHRTEGLPPDKLYKAYFVVDGHHIGSPGPATTMCQR